MTRVLFSLVLLVSCAHALVHLYELSLPGLEQAIATDFFPGDSAAGKAFSGYLSNSWRLWFGFGAIAAGWLVDRFGSRRMLILYLLGCATACGFAAGSSSQSALFAAMMAMGACGSIYHPAGLALISHETTADNRTAALGIHGVFGSAGIGLAPLLAGALLAADFEWRQVYLVLIVPGVALALCFLTQFLRYGDTSHHSSNLPSSSPTPHGSASTPAAGDWQSFFTLTAMAAIQGFVYAALLSFLPRYLKEVESSLSSLDSQGNFAASLVLWVGCVGQFVAGLIARSRLLERQLTAITFANVPFLLWMAVATGWQRVAAAGLFALIHFMHQPIYNSLIAKYSPKSRRSLSYGFSFAMGFGVGSFGAGFAGRIDSDFVVYATLAALSSVAGCVCLVLTVRNPVSS